MFKIRAVGIAALSALALTLAACGHPPPPPQPVPQPMPPPPPPPVAGPQTMSERSLMTMAADLAFGKGSYTLTRAGKAKLSQVVPALQGLQGSKVVVYGYTDNAPVGKALQKRGIADNLDLSSKRANEVVRYLRSKGVDPNIMSAKGRGDTHPAAPNDTPAGRAQNRRIELVVEQPS